MEQERAAEQASPGLLCQLDLFHTKRGTVRFKRVLFVRRAVAEVGTHEDERRTRGLAPRRAKGFFDGRQVIPVFHCLRVPAIGLQALRAILVGGDRFAPAEAHAVVIEKGHQLAELQLPASEAASLATPSMRSPSLTSRKV